MSEATICLNINFVPVSLVVRRPRRKIGTEKINRKKMQNNLERPALIFYFFITGVWGSGECEMCGVEGSKMSYEVKRRTKRNWLANILTANVISVITGVWG